MARRIFRDPSVGSTVLVGASIGLVVVACLTVIQLMGWVRLGFYPFYGSLLLFVIGLILALCGSRRKRTIREVQAPTPLPETQIAHNDGWVVSAKSGPTEEPVFRNQNH